MLRYGPGGYGAVVLVMVVLATACSAGRHAPPPLRGQPPDPSATQANLDALEHLVHERQDGLDEPDYVIAAGDLVAVTIYSFRMGGGTFESDVRVDDRGYISLPVIAPIRAAGLSPDQLRGTLVEALRRAQVLTQPLVSVFLKDYQGQRVVVLGAVARPGLYYISRGRQTITDMLSLAGGLHDRAGNYLLLRPAATAPSGSAAKCVQEDAPCAVDAAIPLTAPRDEMLVIRLEGPGGSSNPTLLNLTVRGGDLLVVPEAGQAFIEGEVERPGLYPVHHGMTVTQLIANAGGLTYPADPRRVKLIRTATLGESHQWEIDTEDIDNRQVADVALEPNDRIVVPHTTGRKVAYGLYKTVTAIVSFSVGGALPIF